MVQNIILTGGAKANPGDVGNPEEGEGEGNTEGSGGTNGDDYALQDVVEVRS